MAIYMIAEQQSRLLKIDTVAASCRIAIFFVCFFLSDPLHFVMIVCIFESIKVFFDNYRHCSCFEEIGGHLIVVLLVQFDRENDESRDPVGLGSSWYDSDHLTRAVPQRIESSVSFRMLRSGLL